PGLHPARLRRIAGQPQALLEVRAWDDHRGSKRAKRHFEGPPELHPRSLVHFRFFRVELSALPESRNGRFPGNSTYGHGWFRTSALVPKRFSHGPARVTAVGLHRESTTS